MPSRIRDLAVVTITLSIAIVVASCGGGTGSATLTPAPSNLSYTSPVTAIVGVAISPLTPTVTGSVKRYSATPSLPTGLSLNATSGLISGTPTAASSQTTYVITASNPGGSTTFPLSLAVTAGGSSVALSAASLTFANQLVSTTSNAQTVAVINLGVMPISIGEVAISGPASSAFRAASSCGTVAQSATCKIDVSFSPNATGSATATLNIPTNTANTMTVKLFGAGAAVAMSFNPQIVAAGSTATLTWSATGATSCTASGAWNGSEPVLGSLNVTPVAPGYYSYALSCAGSGTASAVLTAYGATPSVSEPANELGYQAAFYLAPPNQIVGLQTNLTVPSLPPVPTQPGAALFLWPGLGPATNSTNFNPINDGVLQPVLSWGPSCAPASQPAPFSSWWISAQYVNTFGDAPGYSGCYSGSSMLVSPGDVLLINLTLDATSGIWTQTATDSNTNQSVSFAIDMQGQGQNWAYFATEFWFDATIEAAVTFTNTTLTFQSPDTTNWCSNSQGETNEYVFTPPTTQNDATRCFISSIVLTKPH